MTQSQEFVESLYVFITGSSPRHGDPPYRLLVPDTIFVINERAKMEKEGKAFRSLTVTSIDHLREILCVTKIDLSPKQCPPPTLQSVPLGLAHAVDAHRMELWFYDLGAALLLAVYHDRLDIVKFLIEEAKVNPRYTGHLETPVNVACKNGKHDIILYFARHHPSLFLSSDAQYNQPLHLAVKEAPQFIIGELLQTVYRPRTDSYQIISPPNQIANFLPEELIVRILSFTNVFTICTCQRVSRQFYHAGKNPLLWMLFAVHQPNVRGQLAIHIAAQRGDSSILDLVSKATPDLMKCTNLGQTALHVAVEKNITDPVLVLIEQAISKFTSGGVLRPEFHKFLNARDNTGKTALFWAAYRGNETVVKSLVDCGADVTCTDSEGQSAFTVAKTDRVSEILRQKNSLLGCN